MKNYQQESATKKPKQSTEQSLHRHGQQPMVGRELESVMPGQSSLSSQQTALPSSAVVQTKLTVNEPDDQYEQEAERVADTVMRMPLPMVAPPASPSAVQPPVANPLHTLRRRASERNNSDERRKPPGSGPSLMRVPTYRSMDISSITQISPVQALLIADAQAKQAKAVQSRPPVSPALESRIKGMNGGGSPLPDSERTFFESRMGADFSGVRIHTDHNAVQTSRDIKARAFTTHNNIAFNLGEYQPGTTAGRHLLAHELTHTVQQGAAGELKRKPEADEGVCPVCGKKGKGTCDGCGQPFVQRKAISLPPPPSPLLSPELNAEEMSAVAVPPTSDNLLPGPEESNEGAGQTLTEEGAKERKEEAVGKEEAAGKEAKTTPGEENKASGPPAEEQKETQKLEPQGGAVKKEEVPTVEQKPVEAVEAAPAKAKAATAEAGNVMQGAQGENEAGSAAVLSESTEAKEAQKGKADEALSQATGAMSQASSATSTLEGLAAEAEVDPVDYEAVRASVTEVVIQRKIDGGSGSDNDVSAKASAMLSSFIGGLSSQAATVTATSSTVPDNLTTTIQEAQTTIQAAVSDNQSIITDTISEIQAQVSAEAENTRAEIQAQYDHALSQLEASTQAALEKVNQDYETKLTFLPTLQTTKEGDIDKAFNDAKEGIIAAGDAAAADAVAKGEIVVAEYQSKEYPEPSFSEGEDFPARKREAAINAAKSTAQGYHDELKSKAQDTASQVSGSKPDAIAEVEARLEQTGQLLEQEYKAAKTEIESAHKESLAQAEETLSSQLDLVDQSLESTTTSLSDLEQRLQTQLVEMGSEQTSATEESGQKAISSIGESIAKTANSIEGGLSGLSGQIAGQGVPDLAALQAALGEAEGQFSGALADVKASFDEQIAAASEMLNEQALQSLDMINAVGEQALEQASPIGEEFSASMGELLATSETAFETLVTGHEEASNARADQASSRFDEAVTACETEIDEMVKALTAGLTQFVTDFKEGEGGLLDTVRKVEAEARAAALDAESKVPPAWKKIVATVLTVIVSVIVAVAIAALVASGVGLVAGLLIAAGIGAIGGIAKGMVENWSQGEKLFKDIGKHALKGAIDGALQFAGGRFVKFLKLPDVGLKKLVTESAVDTAAGALTGIAELAVDGQLTLENVLDVGISSLISGAFQVGGGRLTEGLTDGLDDGMRKTLTQSGAEFASDTVEGVTQAVVSGEPIDMTQILTEAASSQAASAGMEHSGAQERMTEGFDSLNDRSSTGETKPSATDFAPDTPTTDDKTPIVKGESGETSTHQPTTGDQNLDQQPVNSPEGTTLNGDNDQLGSGGTEYTVTNFTPDIPTTNDNSPIVKGESGDRTKDENGMDVDSTTTQQDESSDDNTGIDMPPVETSSPNRNRDLEPNNTKDDNNRSSTTNGTSPTNNSQADVSTIPADVEQILRDNNISNNEAERLLQAGLSPDDVGLLALERGTSGVQEQLQRLDELQGEDVIFFDNAQQFVPRQQAEMVQNIDTQLVVEFINNLRDDAPSLDPNTNIILDQPSSSFIDEAGNESYGYYDPETGRMYVNTHISGWQETIAHEAIHMLSDVGRSTNAQGETIHQIGLSQDVYDAHDNWQETRHNGLNEGFTELMTIQVADRMGITAEAAYVGERQIAQALADRVGMDAVQQHYFAGDVNGLRQAVDTELGAGAFDQISQLVGNGSGIHPNDLTAALDIIQNGLSNQPRIPTATNDTNLQAPDANLRNRTPSIPDDYREALEALGFDVGRQGDKDWAKKKDWITAYYEELDKIGVTYESLLDDFITNNPYGMDETDAHIIFGYTTNLFYKRLNVLLRDGVSPDKTSLMKALLNNALSKMPLSSGNQYRGIDLPNSVLPNFLAEHEPGEVVTYNDFISIAENIVPQFWDDANVRITIQNSLEAHDITDLAFGAHFEEQVSGGARKNSKQESLLKAGTSLLVKEVTKETVGGRTVYNITLEQIPS